MNTEIDRSHFREGFTYPSFLGVNLDRDLSELKDVDKEDNVLMMMRNYLKNALEHLYNFTIGSFGWNYGTGTVTTEAKNVLDIIQHKFSFADSVDQNNASKRALSSYPNQDKHEYLDFRLNSVTGDRDDIEEITRLNLIYRKFPINAHETQLQMFDLKTINVKNASSTLYALMDVYGVGFDQRYYKENRNPLQYMHDIIGYTQNINAKLLIYLVTWINIIYCIYQKINNVLFIFIYPSGIFSKSYWTEKQYDNTRIVRMYSSHGYYETEIPTYENERIVRIRQTVCPLTVTYFDEVWTIPIVLKETEIHLVLFLGYKYMIDYHKIGIPNREALLKLVTTAVRKQLFTKRADGIYLLIDYDLVLIIRANFVTYRLEFGYVTLMYLLHAQFSKANNTDEYDIEIGKKRNHVVIDNHNLPLKMNFIGAKFQYFERYQSKFDFSELYEKYHLKCRNMLDVRYLYHKHPMPNAGHLRPIKMLTFGEQPSHQPYLSYIIKTKHVENDNTHRLLSMLFNIWSVRQLAAALTTGDADRLIQFVSSQQYKQGHYESVEIEGEGELEHYGHLRIDDQLMCSSYANRVENRTFLCINKDTAMHVQPSIACKWYFGTTSSVLDRIVPTRTAVCLNSIIDYHILQRQIMVNSFFVPTLRVNPIIKITIDDNVIIAMFKMFQNTSRFGEVFKMVFNEILENKQMFTRRDLINLVKQTTLQFIVK